MYAFFQAIQSLFFYYLLAGFVLSIVESIGLERSSFFISTHIIQIVSHCYEHSYIDFPSVTVCYPCIIDLNKATSMCLLTCKTETESKGIDTIVEHHTSYN